MDKEITCITEILSESKEALTTSQISKEIFERYQIKMSRKIVQNYLWSYFRNLVEYNSSDYTYSLSGDEFLLDDIYVEPFSRMPRALSAEVSGSSISVKYNKTLNIETLIHALALLNYKYPAEKKRTDLIKQINRIIDQLGE